MKLTLHIDDAHAPAIIQLIAELIHKSANPLVEANPDPAPGHPELPLEDEGDLRWGIAGKLPEVAGLRVFQNLKVKSR